MEPISLLAVGLSSIIAALAREIVTKLWRKYPSPRPPAGISIVTESGEKIAIGKVEKLSDAKLQEIIGRVERAAKDSSSTR